jgi:hypothetical protein
MILGARFPGLVDQHERHERRQKAACLKRKARIKRHADHGAEDRERTKPAGAHDRFIGNGTDVFHQS